MYQATRSRFTGGDPLALTKRIHARRQLAPNQGAAVEDEEIVLDCTRCPYDLRAHVDGKCPDEATAVAVWGRS